MTTPWPQPTSDMPPRVNGRVIVAAVKLPTGPGALPHQWDVVVEDLGGTFTVWRMYRDTDGHPRAARGIYGLTYARAVERMVARAASLLDMDPTDGGCE